MDYNAGNYHPFSKRAMTQTPSVKTQQMQVGGMDCGSCAAKIEAGVQKIPGVAQISVSVATERLSVTENFAR